MEHMLLLAPTIFSFWTGILIAWSLCAAAGIYKTIHYFKKRNLPVRKSDKIALTITLMGAILFCLLLFCFSEFSVMIIDVMLGLDLWYTIFLSYLTITSLYNLPSIAANHSPRKA